MLDINNTVETIMTDDPCFVKEDAILNDVAKLFEQRNFHHLPVLDAEDKCIGIISMSDILQLQDKFSRFKMDESKTNNEEFFSTLIAKDVMSNNIVTVKKGRSISDVITLFLPNKFRAIVITENEKLIGIITPYDILANLITDEHNKNETVLSLPK